MAKRLPLCLDLDDCLISTSFDPRIKTWLDARPELWEDVHCVGINGVNFYVKTRPHLREFLKQMTLLYELYLCTQAKKTYTMAVLSWVDPKQEYFGSRIFCTPDDMEVAPGQKKDVEKMLPTLYMDAIVLDDRPDVWTTPNRVIRVHPYEYWQFGSGTTFLLSTDNVLLSLGAVLKAIHGLYCGELSLLSTDSKAEIKTEMLPAMVDILQAVYTQTLKGIHFHWCGTTSENDKKLAVQYGATHTKQIDNLVHADVTHLIGTEIPQADLDIATARRLSVVSIRWLHHCAAHFIRASGRSLIPSIATPPCPTILKIKYKAVLLTLSSDEDSLQSPRSKKRRVESVPV